MMGNTGSYRIVIGNAVLGLVMLRWVIFNLTRSNLILLDSIGQYWILLDITGYYWMSLATWPATGLVALLALLSWVMDGAKQYKDILWT